tara:strand:- start:1 stop:390 length:390 start_codon:yes stop_codon:yes gene_type:complete
MTQKDWENTETTRSYIEAMVVEYAEGLLDELLGSTEEEKISVCTNEDMICEEWTEFQDRNHELVDWCREVLKTYQSKRIAISLGHNPYVDVSLSGEKFESYGDFVREYLYEKIDDYKDARLNYLTPPSK